MSHVFVARETALGRQVVIKLLPPEMAASANTERFRREIQLAASLQHPHFVPLLAAGQVGDLFYYTMPLVARESLRSKLAREGELRLVTRFASCATSSMHWRTRTRTGGWGSCTSRRATASAPSRATRS
jgi:serine/threonine protein kinase